MSDRFVSTTVQHRIRDKKLLETTNKKKVTFNINCKLLHTVVVVPLGKTLYVFLSLPDNPAANIALIIR